MAITDIPEYAHLSKADIEELGRELDKIRADIEADRGERDARYPVSYTHLTLPTIYSV